MSATPQQSDQQSDEHTQPEPGGVFERLVEKLIDDPQLCVWCFAKRRRIYEEYDRLRDDHLRNSTLQVITATSDPDPATYSEVVPPKMDEEQPWIEIEPPRPRCICGDCANIDIDLDKHRSNAMLVKASKNMVKWLNKEHDKGLNVDAAADRVRELTSTGRAGQDKVTLASALRYSFIHAGDDGDDDPIAGVSNTL